MRTFFRKKLLREDFLGLDSVQGYLELATWYSSNAGIRLFVHKSDGSPPDTMLAEFSRLEKEGYVEVQWEPYGDGDDEEMMLKSICLTTAGHKLLSELQERSAGGRLKRRASDLLWVVVVSMLTTLVTLQVKGCMSPASGKEAPMRSAKEVGEK